MGNIKKLFITVAFFSVAVLGVFAQSNTDVLSESQLAEQSILLSQDSPSQESINQDYKGTSTIGVFIKMIVVLIIVIAMIYGVLWFVKKKTNVVKTDDDFLRRAAYINIAPGKTIEVITLIDKAFLIGVTEDNITMLGEIQDDELIKAMNLAADKKNNTKKPANFSEVLDMFLVRNNKSKNVFSDTEQKIDNMFVNKEE